MTTVLRLGLVGSLVALLTCSLALGAAAPAAAADGSLVADGAVLSGGLGLDEPVNETVRTVETVAGSPEPATPTPTSEPAPTPTPTVMETSTTTGTSNPEPTVEATPDDDPEPTSADDTVGEPVETVTGVATRNSTPDDVGTEATETPVDRRVDETTGETTIPVAELVGTTADTLDETVNETDSAAGATVNETGETVENASHETVRTASGENDGSDEATGNVSDATDGSATGDADGSPGTVVADSVGGVTGVVDVTVSETANGTTLVTTTIDGTVASTVRVVDGGSGPADGPVAGVVETVAEASDELTTAVDGAVLTVQQTTDALTDDVDRTARTTGVLVDGVVASTVDGELLAGDAPGPGHVGSYGGPIDGTTPHESTSPSPMTASGTASAGDVNASAGASPDAGTGDGSGNGSAAAAAGPLAALDGVDPAAGGALLGSLLVAGSFLAARAGLAASATGAGTTTLPQLLFAAFREFALRLAVLAGYSRYDFDDPLENENRAAILETVEASPGINLASLVEETGLAESTARYHLRVLEHEDLLEAAKVRGRRRYVPRSDADLELVAAFEEEATKEVLEALFAHEPATGTTLADALDRDPSTVSHHLSRLSEAGLVDREQDGPALRNSLSPAVRSAFADVEVVASVQQHARADD